MEGSWATCTLSVFMLCILLRATCFADEFVGFQAFPTDMRMAQGVPHEPKVGLIQCSLVCAKNESCTSINYNNVTNICEINTLKMKSSEYRVQQEPGWKLYEKLPCGLGYTSGARCRHIQNLFGYVMNVTYEMAENFCELLGDNITTAETEQDKAGLESAAESAGMYEHAYIWVVGSDKESCSSYRRQNGDIITRTCDENAAIVCERPLPAK